MKLSQLIIFFFILLPVHGLLLPCSLAQTPAFPGAEGYGSFSQGGRGGELMVVETLHDSGPGSLREALEADRPRIVVFEVAGIIDIESPLVIANPFVTVAGQTAPPPGITIRGEQLKVQSNHVVVRHVRFRPGTILPDEKANWGAMDAVEIGKRDSDEVHDVIFDHCSFSWATDENVGIWYNSRRVTVQNSIISEPLHRFPDHEKYPYDGHGMLVGYRSDEISVLRNLFVHNYRRHPYMNAAGHLDFRNNIIYNPGVQVARFNNAANVGKLTTNYVNNLIIPGPSSHYEGELSIRRTSAGDFNGEIFVEGNVSQGNPAGTQNNWRMVKDEETGQPFPEKARANREFPLFNTTTLEAGILVESLIHTAGASLPKRDLVDARLVYDFENRTGGMISLPEVAFGWPNYQKQKRPLDPGNTWQEAHSIDLKNPAEANADFNGNGYTNIEEFLNSTNPHNDVTGEVQPWGGTGSRVPAARSETGDGNGFEVHPNFPNPFSRKTRFNFTAHETDHYTLEVYDSLGRRVTQVADRTLTPGEYGFNWRAGRLPAGVYFLRLQNSRFVKTKRVTLIR